MQGVVNDMVSISRCLKAGIKVEAVPQQQGGVGKCKIQVTVDGKTKLGEQLYAQKGGELNDKIIALYNHYAKQL